MKSVNRSCLNKITLHHVRRLSHLPNVMNGHGSERTVVGRRQSKSLGLQVVPNALDEAELGGGDEEIAGDGRHRLHVHGERRRQEEALGVTRIGLVA